MAPDSTSFGKHGTLFPGRLVEMNGGMLLPVAGYGEFHLHMNQTDTDGSQMCELMLRCVAHVPCLTHTYSQRRN